MKNNQNYVNVYFFFITNNTKYVYTFVKKTESPKFDEKLNAKKLFFEKRHK